MKESKTSTPSRNTIASWSDCRGETHEDSYRVTRQPSVRGESRQKNAGSLVARTITQRLRCYRWKRAGDGRTNRCDVDCRRAGTQKRQRFVEPAAELKLRKRCSAGPDNQQLRGVGFVTRLRRRAVARKRKPETEPMEVEVGGFARDDVGRDSQQMAMPPIVIMVRAVNIVRLMIRVAQIVMVGEIAATFVSMSHRRRRHAPDQHRGGQEHAQECVWDTSCHWDTRTGATKTINSVNLATVYQSPPW